MHRSINQFRGATIALFLCVSILSPSVWSASCVGAIANPGNIYPKELNQLLRKGYQEIIEGKFEQAASTEIQAIRADKDNITARRYLVYCLIKMGQTNDAIQQLALITRAVRPTALDLCLYGAASLQTGDFVMAQESYKAALASEPKMTAAKIGLIKAQASNGNFGDAAETCVDGLKSTDDPRLQAYYRTLFEAVKDYASHPAPVVAITKKPDESSTAAATETGAGGAAAIGGSAGGASATFAPQASAKTAEIQTKRAPLNNMNLNPWLEYKGVQSVKAAPAKH